MPAMRISSRLGKLTLEAGIVQPLTKAATRAIRPIPKKRTLAVSEMKHFEVETECQLFKK
jgi:hypothetical protein